MSVVPLILPRLTAVACAFCASPHPDQPVGEAGRDEPVAQEGDQARRVLSADRGEDRTPRVAMSAGLPHGERHDQAGEPPPPPPPGARGSLSPPPADPSPSSR